LYQQKQIEIMKTAVKLNELVKGQIYNDAIDKRVPLLFTGKIKKVCDMGLTYYKVMFVTVLTEDNKNWYSKQNKYITFYSEESNHRILA